MTIIDGYDITQKITGLGANIRAETPTGTINSTNKSFTTANNRIVPGSIIVTSDGTVTTAYSIVTDTGVLTLTAAPTSTLVIDYTYVDSTSLDIVENDYTALIAYSEAYVSGVTGKSYVTTTSSSEWFDLHLKDYDRRTDVDSGIIDYNSYATDTGYRFFVSNKPIVDVSKVIVTEYGLDFGKVWAYDGADYTDNTSEANSVEGTAFTLFPSGVVTDYAYLGASVRFTKFYVDLSTVGVGGALTATYYNGSSWSSLTLTDGTTELTSSGYISFTLPSDWSATTVNSVEEYYIRLKVGTEFSTNPEVLQIRTDSDYNINKFIDLKNIAVYKSTGEIVLRKEIPCEDYRKIRIDYTYGLGSSSVPETYKELISVIAAKQFVIGLLAGSYDNETSWTYRGTTATLGEPYTQFRESLSWLEKREKELYEVVGKVLILGDV